MLLLLPSRLHFHCGFAYGKQALSQHVLSVHSNSKVQCAMLAGAGDALLSQKALGVEVRNSCPGINRLTVSAVNMENSNGNGP